MQPQRRLEVRQLLTECIGQPGEPPAHHPNGEVLPLDVMGDVLDQANFLLLGF